jgi:PAS domain S-box-containing protein
MRPQETDLTTHPVADPSEQFRQLLDALPVAAYTCDADGLITYFNRQAATLWGREPRLNHPADRYCGSFALFSSDGSPIDHGRCWMALALQNDRAYNREEILVGLPDGGRRTVLAHANPLHDAAGRVVGAVNVLVDMGDRRRAEEAQALLAAIVESSHDAIVSRTLEGRVLTWNQAATRLFGLDAGETIGKRSTEVLPPPLRDHEPRRLARLAAGERVEPYETEYTAPGGERVTISVASSPIHDSSGRVIGASMIGRDVSERKAIVESLVVFKDALASQVADLRRLHAMSVRLSTTLELPPIMDDALRTAAAVEGTDRGILWLCDSDRGALEIGAILGFDDAFTRSMAQLPPGQGASRAAFERRRRVVVEDVETDPLYETCRDRVRRTGVRAVHATPLITRLGKIVGVLTVHFRDTHRPSDRAIHFADLCARQVADSIENARLYEDLRRADRAKNEFLALLAHELRNPLAPIRTATQLLHVIPASAHEGQAALDVIDRQLGHMTRLIDDLLDVARITGGKLELRRARVALTEVIAAATETSRTLIDARDQELIVTMPPEAIELDADLTRLAQVISNLLNNASKFSHPGGPIWLTVAREGSDAVITVRDAGSGIPAAALSRIFDIFDQGGAADSTQGGLGIGLTLVKRLTELHGGSVRAHSDGPGEGSAFTLKLPIALGEPDVRNRERERQAAMRANRALRLLIVDDNRDAADSLGMLMRVLGNEVRIAYDGPEAIGIAADFRPAAVLLDIGLPKMSGYDVARELRKHPHGRDALLIATTGWSQPSDRERCSEAGFDHHLVKPVDPGELTRLLSAITPA